MKNYTNRQDMLLPPNASKMIKNTRILIIGTGAAGNAVASNLILMGFQNLTICDFDHVEDSNLSRTILFRKEDIGKSKAVVAAERLNEMVLGDNPHIVGLHGNIMTDFGKGTLFMDHDIVISCVDTQKCRAFINDWCVRTNTPLFEIGFNGFTSNVTFFAPDDGYEQVSDGKVIDKLPSDDGFFPKPLNKMKVCLRELIGQGDLGEKRNSCSGFKIKDQNLAKIPTIQTASATAAAFVATEFIKYLCGKDTMRNKMLSCFGLTNDVRVDGIMASKKCLIHKEDIPVETLEVASADTIGNILRTISSHYNATPMLCVPSFVFKGHCACCGKEMEINRREEEMFNDERWCEECRTAHNDYETRLNHPNLWSKTPNEISLNSDEALLGMCPEQIGIPTDDIVKVLLVDNDYRHVFLRLKPKG